MKELRQLLPTVNARFPRLGSWEDFVKNVAATWLLLNAAKEGMARRTPDEIGGQATVGLVVCICAHGEWDVNAALHVSTSKGPYGLSTRTAFGMACQQRHCAVWT